MRVFLAFILAIALASAAPAACPHAFAAKMDAVGASPVMDHAEHGHAHHMHHAPEHHAEHNCEDDCDGGPDCSGCALGAVAVLTHTTPAVSISSMVRALSPTHDRHAFAPGFDTPPPRA